MALLGKKKPAVAGLTLFKGEYINYLYLQSWKFHISSKKVYLFLKYFYSLCSSVVFCLSIRRIFVLRNSELGISCFPSSVCIETYRRFMSVTSPLQSDTLILSPIRNGLYMTIRDPATMLDMASLRARPIANPVNPSPVISAETSNPSLLIAITIPINIKRVFCEFDISLNISEAPASYLLEIFFSK